MDISRAFPGQYLKASDLGGNPKVVTITEVEMEDVGDDKKPVLRFEGSDQALVLNQTNSNKIGDFLGYDTDDWRGKRVEIYPTQTQFGSKMVACLRVRAVGEGDLNDPTPF